eukprot:Sspe_Gene.24899::Locus_9935_Transcript_1_1_Confidence_1.000_Length_4476::g.24899::m.24899
MLAEWREGVKRDLQEQLDYLRKWGTAEEQAKLPGEIEGRCERRMKAFANAMKGREEQLAELEEAGATDGVEEDIRRLTDDYEFQVDDILLESEREERRVLVTRLEAAHDVQKAVLQSRMEVERVEGAMAELEARHREEVREAELVAKRNREATKAAVMRTWANEVAKKREGIAKRSAEWHREVMRQARKAEADIAAVSKVLRLMAKSTFESFVRWQYKRAEAVLDGRDALELEAGEYADLLATYDPHEVTPSRWASRLVREALRRVEKECGGVPAEEAGRRRALRDVWVRRVRGYEDLCATEEQARRLRIAEASGSFPGATDREWMTATKALEVQYQTLRGDMAARHEQDIVKDAQEATQLLAELYSAAASGDYSSLRRPPSEESMEEWLEQCEREILSTVETKERERAKEVAELDAARRKEQAVIDEEAAGRSPEIAYVKGSSKATCFTVARLTGRCIGYCAVRWMCDEAALRERFDREETLLRQRHDKERVADDEEKKEAIKVARAQGDGKQLAVEKDYRRRAKGRRDEFDAVVRLNSMATPLGLTYESVHDELERSMCKVVIAARRLRARGREAAGADDTENLMVATVLTEAEYHTFLVSLAQHGYPHPPHLPPTELALARCDYLVPSLLLISHLAYARSRSSILAATLSDKARGDEMNRLWDMLQSVIRAVAVQKMTSAAREAIPDKKAAEFAGLEVTVRVEPSVDVSDPAMEKVAVLQQELTELTREREMLAGRMRAQSAEILLALGHSSAHSAKLDAQHSHDLIMHAQASHALREAGSSDAAREEFEKRYPDPNDWHRTQSAIDDYYEKRRLEREKEKWLVEQEAQSKIDSIMERQKHEGLEDRAKVLGEREEELRRRVEELQGTSTDHEGIAGMLDQLGRGRENLEAVAKAKTDAANSAVQQALRKKQEKERIMKEREKALKEARERIKGLAGVSAQHQSKAHTEERKELTSRHELAAAGDMAELEQALRRLSDPGWVECVAADESLSWMATEKGIREEMEIRKQQRDAEVEMLASRQRLERRQQDVIAERRWLNELQDIEREREKAVEAIQQEHREENNKAMVRRAKQYATHQDGEWMYNLEQLEREYQAERKKRGEEMQKRLASEEEKAHHKRMRLFNAARTVGKLSTICSIFMDLQRTEEDAYRKQCRAAQEQAEAVSAYYKRREEIISSTQDPGERLVQLDTLDKEHDREVEALATTFRRTGREDLVAEAQKRYQDEVREVSRELREKLQQEVAAEERRDRYEKEHLERTIKMDIEDNRLAQRIEVYGRIDNGAYMYNLNALDDEFQKRKKVREERLRRVEEEEERAVRAAYFAKWEMGRAKVAGDAGEEDIMERFEQIVAKSAAELAKRHAEEERRDQEAKQRAAATAPTSPPKRRSRAYTTHQDSEWMYTIDVAALDKEFDERRKRREDEKRRAEERHMEERKKLSETLRGVDEAKLELGEAEDELRAAVLSSPSAPELDVSRTVGTVGTGTVVTGTV